ncbi:MAG TPA: hypothetical protein VLK23_09930 [Thermodesulfobacteriota bacterium]|nr:hypothetical protein [Thermodesulfobacteriota bacterium]
MTLRKALILLMPILILLFLIPFVQSAPRIQFSIVYTNDVMGEVEPCG